MKDKRTYTNIKEYGEDMSHENEIKITNEDRGSGDLTFLIERYKKEIWDWKQKETDWIKTNNLLEGSKKIIEELSNKLVDQVRVISELNFELTKLKKELADKNK